MELKQKMKEWEEHNKTEAGVFTIDNFGTTLRIYKSKDRRFTVQRFFQIDKNFEVSVDLVDSNLHELLEYLLKRKCDIVVSHTKED